MFLSVASPVRTTCVRQVAATQLRSGQLNNVHQDFVALSTSGRETYDCQRGLPSRIQSINPVQSDKNTHISYEIGMKKCSETDTAFAYKKGETWDRLVHQGVHLLQRFVQDNRVHIPRPQQDLQIKVNRELPNGNEFVAYIDAIGELDGTRCLMDWKTTGSRYSDTPAGLLSLDPQLICYSWITGISDVALIVFVRKHQPEIQYLRAFISEKQRMEFARLLENSIGQIESAQFPSHSGIRFPQNGCMSCSHLGLCIDNQPLIDANLIRTSGVNDLAWLDDLVD